MKYVIDDIIDHLDHLVLDQQKYLEEKVQPLDEEALRWRPGPKRWNVFEVVEHLNRFADHYLPKFDEIIERPKKLKKRNSYRSGPIGEYVVKIVKPVNGVIVNKANSPRRANPFLRQLDRSVFDTHIKQQKDLREILDSARHLDLGRNRIPIVGANWLRFNLGDSLRIMIHHAERHYVQLDNLVHQRLD